MAELIFLQRRSQGVNESGFTPVPKTVQIVQKKPTVLGKENMKEEITGLTVKYCSIVDDTEYAVGH